MTENQTPNPKLCTSQSATMTGAQAFVHMLDKHNVDYIFGLCGDTSLPFYDALKTSKHRMRHILTRDERSAGYMADAYARLSQKPGVCEGPSGGGATYILPALIEANDSSVPILAFNSDVATTSRGKYPLTELDQKALMAPLTKWNDIIDDAKSVPHMIRTAFRRMTSGKPGATHLALPINVQRQSCQYTDLWAESTFQYYPAIRFGPDPADVTRAAALIDGAKFPMIVVGGGVVIAGAMGELQQYAEKTGSVVATSISGQGAIAEDHPLALGVVGSNGGTLPTRSVVQQADVIVYLGCRLGSVTTEVYKYPALGDAKIIHIDADPDVLGTNYPNDVSIISDAKLALQFLTDAVSLSAPERKHAAETAVAHAKQEKLSVFMNLVHANDGIIRPENIVHALQSTLPTDAVVVADPGTPCPYLSGYYQWGQQGRHFITNRAHGALGFSLPAAIGAQFARPNSRVVAMMGDGSFCFNAGEMETMVRYNLPIMMVCVNNSVFGWIKAGQKTQFDERYFSVDFNRTNHAAVAQAFGVKAFKVEYLEDLTSAIKMAQNHDGPTMIDITCQPLQDANAPVSEWIA